jgi:hypothetical protein
MGAAVLMTGLAAASGDLAPFFGTHRGESSAAARAATALLLFVVVGPARAGFGAPEVGFPAHLRIRRGVLAPADRPTAAFIVLLGPGPTAAGGALSTLS